MKDSLFTKSPNEMDDGEKAILLAAHEVLKNGDKLYGLSPEDKSHVEYAVGLAVREISELFINKHTPISTLIELSVDDSGLSIAYVAI